MIEITAVQEQLNLVERQLIPLAILASIPLFQNQVYRRVAEVAEKDLSSDPIGRRRLDQKLLPFDHKTGTL
jgi:hypothetical protein